MLSATLNRIVTKAVKQMSGPMPCCFSHRFIWLLCVALLLSPAFVKAQDTLTIAELKKLSLEELMNIEVTSVSRTAEKLTDVASAIQVIRGEDIRRSGATRLPEALRLAPNLQIAQANSHDWGITARGFNGVPLSTTTLADKLLVMIDGRTVYTPLFAGVFWDVQNVLLEDVDRIEVVSGPGGTLWGANAVNGVISVISKEARETQGLYATSSVGTFLENQFAMRYGGSVDSNLFFRIYAQHIDQRNTTLTSGGSAGDDWEFTQGGFRLDYYLSKATTFTLQGDLYGGDQSVALAHTVTNGQNILGRFKHVFSERADISLQLYFDHTWRRVSPSGFYDDLKTYDADFQHRFSVGKRHVIVWGAGYRFMQPFTSNFTPQRRDMSLVSGFIQDEITVLKDLLKLTLGTKLLNNIYSGLEYQPSGRVTLTPGKRHTLWAAVSRAVRTPSRLDIQLTASGPVNERFDSEKVLAYELGYRIRPVDRMTFSVSLFYNQYNDLRSIDTNSFAPVVLVFDNHLTAETWGLEVSANYKVADWWRLRGGYTYLGKEFEATSAPVVADSEPFEAIDPRNQWMLQSIMDLPGNFQLDIVGRYTDELPNLLDLLPVIPAYYALDVRLAWQYKRMELALVGRNLIEDQHPEFAGYEIPRSLYGKLTCRF